MSESPELQAYVPPIVNPDGRLHFHVFLSGPTDCRELKEQLILALHELSVERERDIQLIPIRWEGQALSVAHPAQEATLGQLPVPLHQFQIVIGVTRHRIGPKTRQEIDAVVAPRQQRPFVLFFWAIAMPEANDTRSLELRIEQLRYRDDLHARFDSITEPFKDARDLRNLLKDRLSPYLRAARKAHAAAAASPKPPPVAPLPPAPPLDPYPIYVGLRPYDRKHAQHFFGRAALTEELLGLIVMGDRQTMLLKGHSGAGKSSLMFAGVLPRLPGTPPRQPRNFLYLSPGADPFLALARAMNQRRSDLNRLPEHRLSGHADEMAQSPGMTARVIEAAITLAERRVLYIDQLEELLVETADAATAEGTDSLERKQRFVDALEAFVKRDRRNVLVASIRSDYLDKLGSQTWRTLAELFQKGHERWIHAPENADIDRIVIGPCERAGYAVDPRLLSALRDDIVREKAWPPLLSACLHEMVEHRRDGEGTCAERRLTLGDYARVGGIGRIIQRRAEATESGLTHEQAVSLPGLFARLVQLDRATGRPTKARLVLQGLAPQVRLLVDHLLRHSLLAYDGQVELSHDALFEGWPRLQRWIAGHLEPLLDDQDYRQRAQTWERMTRPPRKLATAEDLYDVWTGPRLGMQWARADVRAEEWLQASKRSALIQLLSSDRNPLISMLVRLVRDGVRLTSEDLQALKPAARTWYYATRPDEAKAAAHEPPADSSARGGFTGSTAVDETSADPLNYFEADHLTLRLGADAQHGIGHIAALFGHVHLLQRLAQLGLDLDECTPKEEHLLSMAAYGGQVETISWLLAREADPGRRITTVSTNLRNALHSAALAGGGAVTRLLLSHLPPSGRFDLPDEDGWTPLLISAYVGDLESTQAIVESGGAQLGARARNWGLLMTAISRSHWAITRWLLEAVPAELLELQRGYDAERTGCPPHMLVVKWNETQDDGDRTEIESLLRLMLSKGVSPDLVIGPERRSLLGHAAACGCVNAVEALAPAATLSHTDAAGWTALHHALAGGHEPCAVRLIDAGGAALVAARGPDAPTALDLALRRGLHEAVQHIADLRAADARWGPEMHTVVSALEKLEPVDQMLRKGQAASVLLSAGMPPPRFAKFQRDAAGRIYGVEASTPWSLPKRRSHAWAQPPVLNGAWQALDSHAAGKLLAHCVANGALTLTDAERFRVTGARTLLLPYYSEGRLIEFSVEAPFESRPGALLVLSDDEKARRLNGSTLPIHEINGTRLKIAGPTQAVEYLKLFSALGTSREGIFRIFDRPEFAIWAPGHAADSTVQALAAEPRHVVDELDAPGTWLFACTIVYKRIVYECEMRVRGDGTVEMLSDRPLTPELPLLGEYFDNGLFVRRAAAES